MDGGRNIPNGIVGSGKPDEISVELVETQVSQRNVAAVVRAVSDLIEVSMKMIITRVGRGPTIFERLEAGDATLTDEDLERLAGVLQVPVVFLLRDDIPSIKEIEEVLPPEE